jgi:hypothetical protein
LPNRPRVFPVVFLDVPQCSIYAEVPAAGIWKSLLNHPIKKKSKAGLLFEISKHGDGGF